MKIEGNPLAARVNRCAGRLKPEHREELYRIVMGFLSVGAIHGMLAKAASRNDKEGGEQDKWIAYLQTKADESRLAVAMSPH